MNEQNLRTPTTEEAREIGRKGGIASGKARLRKKRGRELLRSLLEMKETDPQLIRELERLGVDAEDITNEVVMHARQIEKAKRKGDTSAYTAIFKAAGYVEEGAGEQNISITISPEAAKAGSKWSSKK